MVTIFLQFKTPFLSKILLSRCEYLIFKELRKTEKVLFFAHKSTTIFVSTPVKPTGFFVFFPKNYPQKPPLAVSGKLSATPKQYKTAQLLKFFGKHLCHSRFLTQCVTYYKSTLVYYNIFAILYQATIHASRDSN